MIRNLEPLTQREYDLAVVGGGVFGACAAWDAAQRGLSVCLVDRRDFGCATSAHSFKMIHGGIRYLQHGDVRRIRQSARERRAFLRIAPHLVGPLPIVIPTYGHGMKGKGALRVGMGLYDLLTLDKNRGIRDPGRRIPWGRCLSRRDALEMFPLLESAGLTGGAVFCDGQMYNPPRLVLGIVRSAVEAGADAANYVEVIGFTSRGGRVSGVEVRDALTGEGLSIRARVVLNAAGPYAESLLRRGLSVSLEPEGCYSRDTCFVVPRRLFRGESALAVLGKTADPDAKVGRGARHLFMVPWRQYTLVGVWHVVHEGDPDGFAVTQEELRRYLAEINSACPQLGLTMEDVALWNAGLVPFGENLPGARDLRYAHRSRLVDHGSEHGIEGLVTLIGIRYTTGRCEAARAVDLAFRKLGRRAPRCRTAVTPIHGGRVGDFEAHVSKATEERPAGMSPEVVRALAHNYGSAHGEVLKHLDGDSSLGDAVGKTTTIKAQVIHAVREEMAQKLDDVVFRRTDLATGEYPGAREIGICADLMARELGWDEARVEEEIAEVNASFPGQVPAREGGCVVDDSPA